MWSEQSPASSLNCPCHSAFGVSVHREGNSNCFTLERAEGVSTSCLKITKKTVNHGFIKLIQKRIGFVDWYSYSGLQLLLWEYPPSIILKSETVESQYTVPLDPPLGIVY